MPGEYIASIIGLIATSQIHLAKGLQRFGIAGFSKDASFASSRKRSARKRLYILALLLNNLAFLWVIAANMFAPPAAYTSMFGFGLIVLMFFSEKVLGERVGKTRHAGAVLLAVGTFFLGWAGIRTGRGSSGGAIMAQIDIPLVLWVVLAFFTVMGLILTAAKLRGSSPRSLGIITGLITGVSGACDPIFKAIAQHYGGISGFLPSSPAGWALFLFSFLFGTIALLLTQVGFAWKADATVLVPAHNMALIIFPLLLLRAALPDYPLTILHLPGILLAGAGMVLLFIFKQ